MRTGVATKSGSITIRRREVDQSTRHLTTLIVEGEGCRDD